MLARELSANDCASLEVSVQGYCRAAGAGTQVRNIFRDHCMCDGRLKQQEG